LSLDTRYAPYAKETALCVDLAYGSMEEDIAAEIQHANGETKVVLMRLLNKLHGRRNVLNVFSALTTRSE